MTPGLLHTRVSASGRGMPSGAALDPQALMKIKNLELRARTVVEGFLSGLHRSPYHGFSVEFTEYRQYSPGDDVRYLDWKLYARSDRYFLKRFEDETNLRCYLLVDVSESMQYGSLSYTKADYARTAAATLAFFLSLQRDAVGIMTFDEQVDQYIPPRFRPGHLHRVLASLEKPPRGAKTDLVGPIEQLARLASKRGLVVLISDLLAPVDMLQRSLPYLSTRGHEVIIFRLVDPAERRLPFSSASIFIDMESGRQLYVDPQVAREEYLRRFEAHSKALAQLSAQLGIDYWEMPTDAPLEWALFDFLQARLRRGRLVRRRGDAKGGS
ncbi:MAG: hypothetical protein KatS3mg110_2039 [Pirellulaceae bacterium]|nr:MAG: hypothetical protein KatS3mg110_2039 [Pirellulaceae bacterium]